MDSPCRQCDHECGYVWDDNEGWVNCLNCNDPDDYGPVEDEENIPLEYVTAENREVYNKIMRLRGRPEDQIGSPYSGGN